MLVRVGVLDFQTWAQHVLITPPAAGAVHFSTGRGKFNASGVIRSGRFHALYVHFARNEVSGLTVHRGVDASGRREL